MRVRLSCALRPLDSKTIFKFIEDGPANQFLSLICSDFVSIVYLKRGLKMTRSIERVTGLFVAILLLSSWGCQSPQASGPQEKAFFSPQTHLQLQQNILGPQSTRSKGELQLLILAVRFPDVKPRFSLEMIKKKVVADLDGYLKAQSYGKAWIKPHFMGWISLPDSISEYRVSPNNFRVDRRRVRKLIEDAMTEVETKIDFSRYQHMLIVPGVMTTPGRGYGMMCYCANPGMLTGVRGNPRYVVVHSKGGKTFSGGIFVGTENAPLGMFAHDFFHALGGVEGNKRLVP